MCRHLGFSALRRVEFFALHGLRHNDYDRHAAAALLRLDAALRMLSMPVWYAPLTFYVADERVQGTKMLLPPCGFDEPAFTPQLDKGTVYVAQHN